MRTMPAVLASSVVVVSADRAHRMQRSTSTEAMGRGLESILAEDEGTSESEDEAEAKLWLINAAAGIFLGGRVCCLVCRCEDGAGKAETVDLKQASRGYLYFASLVFCFLFLDLPSRRGGLNRSFAG